MQLGTAVAPQRLATGRHGQHHAGAWSTRARGFVVGGDTTTGRPGQATAGPAPELSGLPTGRRALVRDAGAGRCPGQSPLAPRPRPTPRGRGAPGRRPRRHPGRLPGVPTPGRLAPRPQVSPKGVDGGGAVGRGALPRVLWPLGGADPSCRLCDPGVRGAVHVCPAPCSRALCPFPPPHCTHRKQHGHDGGGVQAQLCELLVYAARRPPNTGAGPGLPVWCTLTELQVAVLASRAALFGSLGSPTLDEEQAK